MRQASRVADRIVTLILGVCVVIVLGLAVRRRETGPAAATVSTYVKNWHAYATGRERIGSAGANVTVVLFSDFECPYCQSLAAHLSALAKRHPGGILIIHRNYPLVGIHPGAWKAALGAECAAIRGRFPEYFQYMTTVRPDLHSVRWTRVANEIGLADSTSFDECIEHAIGARRVSLDTADARALGVRGTPFVLVNGWAFQGMPPDSTIERLIEVGHERQR